MSGRELQLDALEICDGLTVEDMKRIFGLERPPIDTAARRLEAWNNSTASGGNVVRVRDVSYSWDARPRRQKNGALIGRVYAQARGEGSRDVGSYKIDHDGVVVHVPAALRGMLPGSELASASTDEAAGSAEPQ